MKKVVNEGVPHIFKNAKNANFMESTLDFDKEMLFIKQQLCDEDEAQNLTQPWLVKFDKIKGKVKDFDKFERK